MSFVEKIQRRIHSRTSMFGTWLPTDRVNVGEYGLLRLGRFNREGQVRQRGVAFNENRSALVPSKLGFSDRAKFVTRSSLSADVGRSMASGALDISLSGAGAFVYQLEDIVAKRIADKEAFFTALFLAILCGKLKWQDKFVLIDEVREVGSATIIVLESDSGKLVLRGNIPAGAESSAPLAKVGAQVSVDVESGSVFQAIGEASTTPLYSLRRLVFDPFDPLALDPIDPPGPGKALSEMVAWLQEKLGLSVLKPDVVRRIDYVSSDDYDAVRFTLSSDNLSFLIKAESLSLEHFLDLGSHGEEIESAFPIEEEHQSQYIQQSGSGAG